MATLGITKKLSAVNRDSKEKYPRSNQSLHTTSSYIQPTIPPLNQDYFTQLSEEIDSRVADIFSQEFGWAESHFLGALLKLNEFLLNSHLWLQSGTIPGTSQNLDKENQEPNQDRSQKDPRTEVSTSVNSSPEYMKSDPDKVPYRNVIWRANFIVFMISRELECCFRQTHLNFCNFCELHRVWFFVRLKSFCMVPFSQSSSR